MTIISHSEASLSLGGASLGPGSPLRGIHFFSSWDLGGDCWCGTLPPCSGSEQFCSGPKLACFTQPDKGSAGGELTLLGEGSLVTCVVNVMCPMEL